MAPTLRPRNSWSKRVAADSSRSIAGKVVVKKTNEKSPVIGNGIDAKKMRKQVFIPRDFLLDTILPFLTNRQLYPLRFVKRFWKWIIETGVARGQLSGRPVIHKITFTTNSRLTFAIDLGKTHPIEKDDEEEVNKMALKSILAKKLSLVDESPSDFNSGASYYIYIDPKAGWRAKSHRLRLELPKRPKTLGELRFVRYWLGQLARAHVSIGEVRDIPLCPAFIHALFSSNVNKNGEQTNEESSDFHFSFDTLKTHIGNQRRELHRCLLPSLAHTSHLDCESVAPASDQIDFFLGCRRPIRRSAEIRQHCHIDFGSRQHTAPVVTFIVDMAMRLKQLDADQLLGQLPARMAFNTNALEWEEDMLAALQSGGHIRYVQTSHSTAVRGGQHQELVELVVDCGGGAVEARIHVKLHFEEAYDDVFVNVLLLLPFVKQILVEIVASKV